MVPIMVVLAASPAWGADWPVLVDELVAGGDLESREALLTEALLAHADDPDGAARVASAVQVVRVLHEAGRSDAATVRAFLDAAVSPDLALRALAVAQARSGGEAPGSLGAPLAMPAAERPAPAVDPSALSAYAERRLFRDTLELSFTDPSISSGAAWSSELQVSTWGVYDGAGALYGARAFAEAVGDEEGLEVLTERRRRLLALEGTVVGAGAGLLLSGTVVVLTTPDRGRRDLLWTGSALSVAGSLTLAVGLATLNTELRFGDLVSRRYRDVDADQWIEVHNSALQEELGLSDPDLLGP